MKVKVQPCTRPMNRGKNRYPLNGRLVGFQRHFVCFGGKENLLLSQEFEPQIIQPVTLSYITTKPFRLLYSMVKITTLFSSQVQK
jgi:hypothetical protein